MNVKEILVDLTLFNSLINRAIYNQCEIVLFNEASPEKFEAEMADLASRHADTVTVYKTLDGRMLFASDLHFNPYGVKTIASIDVIKDLKNIARSGKGDTTPVFLYDDHNGELYSIEKVEGTKLFTGDSGANIFNGDNFDLLGLLQSLPNEGTVVVVHDGEEHQVNLIDETLTDRIDINFDSNPDLSDLYDDEGNLAESSYALKPMIEELESKGYKVIDEGSSDDITVYVYNTDEEFTQDIFLALIFGSNREYNPKVGENPLPEASYELVDIVDSGFQSKYPGKYKEIEEIAKKNESETEAVRMESLAGRDASYEVSKEDIKPLIDRLKSKGYIVKEYRVKENGIEEVSLDIYISSDKIRCVSLSIDPYDFTFYDHEDFIIVYPSEFKEIKEILLNYDNSFLDEINGHEEYVKKWATKAVRMESLAAAGDCYKIIKQPLDVSATSFAEQVVFEALESAGGEACESEIKKIIDDQSLWGYYQKSNPGTLRRARENPELIKNGLEELIKDGYVALSDGKSEASNKYDFKTMKATLDGKTRPMRIDNEASMIDIWYDEQGEWIWSEEATDEFYNRRGKMSSEAGAQDHYVVFFEKKNNGEIEPALGSDAVYRLDGRLGLDRMIQEGHQRAKNLSKVKRYDGFKIIRGYLGHGNERALTDLIEIKYNSEASTSDIEKKIEKIEKRLDSIGGAGVNLQDRVDDIETHLFGKTRALHPEQKGGQEIKLRKIAEKYIDEVAKHANTGIVQHAILDEAASDLNKEQIASVRKALVEVGNRNMGNDRIRKEGKEGVIAGSDIAEWASWITSDCMGLTADYLMDSIGDRNAKDTYSFAMSKLEDCLMDFYRNEMNKSNYEEIYRFWEDLIYGKKAFGASEESDFFTVYLMKEKTPEEIENMCKSVETAFDTQCAIVDNSAFNVMKIGKLSGNESAMNDVASLIGQSEVLEIA